MARHAREKSSSGIYHIMLQGIDRREIFSDDEDREVFLELLKHYREECGYKLYAYCLMGNHVHLLLQVREDDAPDKILKRIGVAYVYRYNAKYQRCGSLFRGRFRSECVEEDSYFLTVLRYIVQNPVKTGICASPNAYPYSSMQTYLGKKDDGLTDTGYALEICGQKELLRFLQKQNEDQCLEMSTTVPKGMSENSARELVRQTLGDFPDLSLDGRGTLAASIRDLNSRGISIRRISRLSGIPKGIVERCLKK